MKGEGRYCEWKVASNGGTNLCLGKECRLFTRVVVHWPHLAHASQNILILPITVIIFFTVVFPDLSGRKS